MSCAAFGSYAHTHIAKLRQCRPCLDQTSRYVQQVTLNTIWRSKCYPSLIKGGFPHSVQSRVVSSEGTVGSLLSVGLKGASHLQDQGLSGAGTDPGVCAHARAGWLLCACSPWPDPGAETSQGCQGRLEHHQGDMFVQHAGFVLAGYYIAAWLRFGVGGCFVAPISFMQVADSHILLL